MQRSTALLARAKMEFLLAPASGGDGEARHSLLVCLQRPVGAVLLVVSLAVTHNAGRIRWCERMERVTGQNAVLGDGTHGAQHHTVSPPRASQKPL